ncbi:protoporphyrinogen oxidase [Arthroderma uncinatum]|uniref:protoporphyrinogen oxidase n=1 Tax=Arthroderma uncinatum TaxID=74035 RepID=UPI00144AC774|nr:protoporphyrinogen oxidase [Arthroderma uncinatum]KAF3484426.1 protoporphyrinogen oxidase [Arthroderma uncinatum]
MGSRRWPGLVTESFLHLQRTALRRRCTRQLLSRTQSLQLSYTPGLVDKQVAVIGGGITGLTTAYYLAQHPTTQVTLYEKSKQLGGWVQTETVETDSGKVVFEYGPRTLRCSLPDVMPTLELITQLDLENTMLVTSSEAPAAVNRYLYYPDHLVRLPGPQPGGRTLAGNIGNLIHVATEPVFGGLIWGLLKEPFRESRDPKLRDESIAEFITRRVGREPADNIASAIFHGIYAGDIDKLSAKTILPSLWECELGETGVMIEMAERSGKPSRYSYNMLTVLKAIQREYSGEYSRVLPKLVSGGSVFSLEGGLNSIAEKITKDLSELPNVKIIPEANVSHIQHDKGNQSLMLVSSNEPAVRYDYVISTTPSKVLADQLRGPGGHTPPTATSRLLASNNYAVNVMVVNLFYNDPDLVPVDGFGYLIPRSVPIEQNPERALGVLFMSEAVVGQDTAEGTKLAVMIGGHWWDGWEESDFPDEQNAIDMAKSVLSRHLGISQQPTIAKARMLRNAIPQYTVGHSERMEELHDSLSREYDSRLKVAGAWYTGIGVNDCIASARAVATSIRQGSHDETGLENYVHPLKPMD